MNIPSNIHCVIPSLILENNSSNNAIWGLIFGDIEKQPDLMNLFNDKAKGIYKVNKIAFATEPAISTSHIINLSDIQRDQSETVKAKDLLLGIVTYGGYDYCILATVTDIEDTKITINIESSIKQIQYVVDDDYVHTDNNYTDAEKSKLEAIEPEAQVNVQSDYTETDTSSDSYIKNKPTIGAGKITIEKNASKVNDFNVNQTTDTVINITLSKTDVGLGNVDNTHDVDKPVSDAVQTQLNLVNNAINGITKSIPAGTSEMNPLQNSDQVNAKIGNGIISFKKNNVQIATIEANQFINSDVDYELVKSDVGLGNVDDTADNSKPVSQPQAERFQAVEANVTALQNGKRDKIDSYSASRTDALLYDKRDKSDSYSASQTDALLEAKADRAQVAAASEDFDIVSAPEFIITDSSIIKLDSAQSVLFNYDDWTEYSYHDTALNVSYLTLLEWEEQADLETYILTLYTAVGNIPLIKYNKTTQEYTIIETADTIDLTYKLGIHTGGNFSTNLDGYIKGSKSSTDVISMNLDTVYGITRAVDYSTNDSIKLIFEELDYQAAQLNDIYRKDEVDGQLEDMEEWVSDDYQPVNVKDSAIPTTPAAGHYPETGAIKSYVDTQIEQYMSGNIYKGVINYCDNTGLQDGDAAPEGSNEGDKVIDISNDNYFLVTSSDTLEIQAPLAVDNGYYYDIMHFVWRNGNSGTIKWNVEENMYDANISNQSGVDNITLEINADNNYQVKDSGIAANHIKSGAIIADNIKPAFLSTITNVQPDWEQTNSAKDDYIKNKPAIPVVPDVATEAINGLMSYGDKAKLDSIESGAKVNVQPDWSETGTSSDAFIKNKPDVYTQSATDALLDGKVDKVSGKGLSANDFTNEYIALINSQVIKYEKTSASTIAWYTTYSLRLRIGNIYIDIDRVSGKQQGKIMLSTTSGAFDAFLRVEDTLFGDISRTMNLKTTKQEVLGLNDITVQVGFTNGVNVNHLWIYTKSPAKMMYQIEIFGFLNPDIGLLEDVIILAEKII
jgi:hypothetical protein